MKADVQDKGTIWILKPLDAEAQAFFDEHLDAPDYMKLGSGAVAFDWRPGRDFARFFQGSGGQLSIDGRDVRVRS